MIETETCESAGLHILENFWSGTGSSSLQSILYINMIYKNNTEKICK